MDIHIIFFSAEGTHLDGTGVLGVTWREGVAIGACVLLAVRADMVSGLALVAVENEG